MKQEFEKFLKSSWGLELWHSGKKIFRSKKSGVQGLLDFITKCSRGYKNIVVFDKIIGQGAALLAAYLKAEEVYGAIGSKLAAITLKKYKIKFYFQETCANILNKDKTGLCPLEKNSLDKTPEKFYNCLVRQQIKN